MRVQQKEGGNRGAVIKEKEEGQRRGEIIQKIVKAKKKRKEIATEQSGKK